MKFITLAGRQRSVLKPKKYLIDWEAASKSKRQREVKKFLEKYWHKQIVFEEFPVAGSLMTFDFYNASKKVAIEVQGAQHTKYVPFFHGKNKINYLSQLKRDQDKYNFCEINSIELLEIYPKDKIEESLFITKEGETLI